MIELSNLIDDVYLLVERGKKQVEDDNFVGFVHTRGIIIGIYRVFDEMKKFNLIDEQFNIDDSYSQVRIILKSYCEANKREWMK